MPILEVNQIHVSFENKPDVLGGISFSQRAGEVVALLGPSGCGKSTLLAVIAGLIKAESGTLRWDSKDLANVPTHKRAFGLMFQDYALFPHMNVQANVAFGPRMQGLSQPEMDRRVNKTLELVGLPGFGDRDVNNLSGGEQQRVALARALAPQPKLLMLDEPLGSLDRALRQRLLDDLRQIIKSTGQTTLYVTHDQEEAYALADRVVVLRAGQVAQIGPPQEIYRHPASVFVARFIGLTNFVPGQADGEMVRTPLGQFPLESALEGNVMVLIRPDEVRVGPGEYQLQGTVTDSFFYGEYTRVQMEIEGQEFTFSLPSGSPPEVGQNLTLSFDPIKGIQVFPGDDA
ncbi:MAG TPA: ABC transporter ATP-binding protein [Anaerolineales bacterium]|nr:ABC transporter ATP-binding protein [Anaerolineales bacterium]